MAKTQAKAETEAAQEISTIFATMASLKKEMAQKQFSQIKDLTGGAEKQAAAVAYGVHEGEETRRILLLALEPGQWEKANADYVQQQSWELTPPGTPEDQYPQFAIVSNGEHQKTFDITFPPHEIDRLPSIREINAYKRFKVDKTYRWSMQVYPKLMKGFDEFHEQVYHHVKDDVSSSNAIIQEVTKLLFLESFRLHHQGADLEFKHEDKTLRLDEVFTFEYVQQHGKAAVAAIQSAFDHFKKHQDYVVTDDAGIAHPIFDDKTHLRLAQPRNYEKMLGLLQKLGPVTDNSGREISSQGTLKDVAADVLGRLLDVFLRKKFKPEGMGVYLTPAPVKRAMLEIAFYDIKTEASELLNSRGEDGTPVFRFCDPACGSYGFGAVAMGYLEQALMDFLGKETSSDIRRDKLFRDMCEHSFVGADNSQEMVTLARVNMALLGAPKAKIFRTSDSLISEQLKPCSYDLICTNPPFGKRKGPAQNDAVLEYFQSDLKERKKKGTFDYEPSVGGLALGGKPDGKGIWKPASSGIDLAILFIDRCLQLLKPGGRLLIVLPDGVLCNSGDRYVREYIMGQKDAVTGQFHGGKAIVKAVISLPSDTFKLSGTGAKTSILYLQKRKANPETPKHFLDEPQKDVFMAVADALGYAVKNNVEDYSTGVLNDLVPIVGAYVRGE